MITDKIRISVDTRVISEKIITLKVVTVQSYDVWQKVFEFVFLFLYMLILQVKSDNFMWLYKSRKKNVSYFRQKKTINDMQKSFSKKVSSEYFKIINVEKKHSFHRFSTFYRNIQVLKYF